MEKRCGKFGDRLRGFFCNAFRGNFAEDQDHDSGYDRGNRRTGVAAEKLDKKHRGKGAESDVDDVVADQDGGKQAVIVLRQLQCAGGPAVAVVRFVFQSDTVEEVNAVSVAEKYPDMATKATRATSIAILVLSITDGSTPLSSKNFCVPTVQGTRLVIHYIIATHKKQINFPNTRK